MKLRKNEVDRKTDNMSTYPCVVEMSDIDFGMPRQLFCRYKHSPCAEIFNHNLKERAGIEAVATYVAGDLKLYPQMQIYVWVKDSAVTEQILQNTPYQSCSRKHPLFRTIIECLTDALQEDDNNALADVSDLWRMQQENDVNGEEKIYVSVTLLSYLRCYTDQVFDATSNEISQIFAEHFPSYETISCSALSLENGPLAHNHLYLFFTPKDQERAEASGDIEKMKRLAYDIIRKKDVLDYISYETYVPQITNRRKLTSEQIFFIARE